MLDKKKARVTDTALKLSSNEGQLNQKKGSNSMLSQTGTLENTVVEAPEPILIRGPRELKWNRVTGTYEWVELTPEMVEQSKRRAAYVAAFNPCGL